MKRPSNTLEAAQQRDLYLRRAHGELLPRILAGELVAEPRPAPLPPHLHVCPLDRECRQDPFGTPPRLHAGMFGWSLDLALAPSGRFASRPGRSSWSKGWFEFGPDPSRTCRNVTALGFVEHEGERYLSDLHVCPLRLGHRGGCLEWKEDVRVQRPRISSSELVVESIEWATFPDSLHYLTPDVE